MKLEHVPYSEHKSNVPPLTLPARHASLVTATKELPINPERLPLTYFTPPNSDPEMAVIARNEAISEYESPNKEKKGEQKKYEMVMDIASNPNEPLVNVPSPSLKKSTLQTPANFSRREELKSLADTLYPKEKPTTPTPPSLVSQLYERIRRQRQGA